MCLEAMFKTEITVGMIFAGAGRQRHQVQVDQALRERVLANAASVRSIAAQEHLPPALSDHRCRRCSMNPACMPKVLAGQAAFARAAASLFTVTEDTPAAWHD